MNNRSSRSLIITTVAGLSLGALVGLYQLNQPPQKKTSETAADEAQSNQPMKLRAKRLNSMIPEVPSESGAPAPQSDEAATPQSQSSNDGGEPNVIVSQERLYVQNALKRPIIDSKTWKDKVSGRYVKGSLVKDDGLYGYVLIKETFEDEKMTKRWGETAQIGDNIMVQFDKNQTEAQLDKFSRENYLSLKSKTSLEGSYVFVSDVVSVDHMVNLEENLSKIPGVRFSEPNFLYFISALPNDPKMSQMWAFKNDGKATNGQSKNYKKDNDTRVWKAWDVATDCSNTMVAVLDTGIDYNHPDLKANIAVSEGLNTTSSNKQDFMDRNNHGSHCAGSIGAVGNNGIGVPGVCWKAKIVPIKVMSDEGSGATDWIMNGVMYAINHPEIKILSMSLGGGGVNNQLKQTFDKAVEKNKLVFVAAGNDNSNVDVKPNFPVSIESDAIVGIGAYDGTGQMSSFSNYGAKHVDIASPGSDIMSTIPVSKAGGNANNAYAAFAGTSMATPIAAGIGALLWSTGPNMKAQDVKKELLARSDKGTFNKAVAGSRKINLEKALEALVPKASLANAKMGESISLVNADTFEFELKNENPYSSIKKIEILNGSEVIGTSEGGKVSGKLPYADGSVKLTVRVTDSAGRVATSEIGAVNIDVTKTVKLDSILVPEKHEGEVECKFERSNEKSEKTALFEAKVDTAEYCEKLCGIIKPTAYTSKGTLSCGAVASSGGDGTKDADKNKEGAK